MATASRLVAIAFVLIAAAACRGGAASGAWPAVDAAGLTPAQRAQSERATAARDELAKSLLAELTAALAGGAPKAIAVCRDRAPALATAVGAKHGVRIGRSSHRLRNPANAPPSWAQRYGEEPCTAPAMFAGPNGELGVVQPIALMPLCVQCHGSSDRLGDGVAAALREQYPSDRAIGFQPGDPRGLFWIEVPPR